MYVITGGGTGIGRALAWELARRNCDVLVIGRRKEPLAETAARHANISYLTVDVSTQQGREVVVAHLREHGPLKGLIHNAGTIHPIIPIHEIEEKDWHQTLAINLDPALFLTQHLSKFLVGGRVLNISSGAAHFPVAGWTAYCVSKAALAMLTQCWQLEVKNTTFASVMPGIIDTDMQALIRQAQFMDEEKRTFFVELKEKNRLIDPDTVALFLSWLLLDTNSAEFQSQEWDIYDTSHHMHWLKPPHAVPPLE